MKIKFIILYVILSIIKVMSFLKRFFPLWLPLIFFVIGLFTLYDYGINWDSPSHFARGQAYLRYILTGKTNYNNLPKFCLNSENLISRVDFKTGDVCNRHRKVKVSQYESDLLNFDRWASKDVYGHPAFSNIMLALSNNIFYKFLGWVEDIESYHLYILFVTFLMALTVSLWTAQTFGKFASIIAVLALYTYPLLFAESHFNVKDPPMATFLTISLYLFWLAIVKKNTFYLTLSAIAGGASFGTKFNFVFAPFILLPWIIFYGKKLLKTKSYSLFSRKMILAFIFYPVIVFLVFFSTWPALWHDPLKNVPQVFKFYKDIGGSSCSDTPFSLGWILNCSHPITLEYAIYTTPPYTLFLFAIGFIVCLFRFKQKSYVSVLWISFFVITIARVTLPISNIYGGLRQIMEFIPPMAMISGVGAWFIRDLIVKVLLKIIHFKSIKEFAVLVISLFILVGFLPIILTLQKLHPNENIYFNSLIGGLKGASERNIPGFGNTYGNAYLQAVKWVNSNAKPNSQLALVSGNTQNIPRGIIREDISFANGYRSGYNLAGEYQIMLTTGQDQFSGTFRSMYLETFLEPVYDLKIDGISIIKVWKNSKEFIKDKIKFDSKQEEIETQIDTNNIIIKLDSIKPIKALTFKFPDLDCKNQIIGAKIYTSLNGEDFLPESDEINGFTDEEMSGFEGDFIFLFPADMAQYIKLLPPENYACELSEINFMVFTFLN